MVIVRAAIGAVTKVGFCSVDSICSSSDLRLRGAGRPTGFNGKLFGIFTVQPLPAAELHRIGADDAADRLVAEKVVEHIEADVPSRGAHRDEATVDVVPEGQPRA